ncbi:hypothetical protein D3C78_935290 [compost metagenome]
MFDIVYLLYDMLVSAFMFRRIYSIKCCGGYNMKWYDRYEQQLEHIFNTAKSRIAAFPQPLHAAGLTYAEAFNPVKQDGGKDYICCLLPFWIKDSAGITDWQCERLALANVYGMLYFFIQDDVMDGSSTSSWKELLALGNLLILEMFNEFRGLFPSESPFWDYYNGYVSAWADSVVNEGAENYFMTDPLRTAGKAGPVKIASTGAFLLAGKQGLISNIEEAVDIILMTLQMSDDWADWREDLADGSYNGLLSMIAGALNSQNPLTEELVEKAIHVKGCMMPYARIARDNHEKLEQLIPESIDLLGFHEYLWTQLSAIAESIDANRQRLLEGGFNYYLSSDSTNHLE